MCLAVECMEAGFPQIWSYMYIIYIYIYKCTTLRGCIKGKSRDTNVMYPDATLYMDTTKSLLIVGLNLLMMLSL